MRLTKEHTNLLAVALISVLLTMQIKSCKKEPNEKLIRNEMKLDQLEAKRKTDSVTSAKIIEAKDSVIAMLKRKDAVIINQYIKADEKLKTIPATVNSLSVQQLVQSAYDY